MPLVSFCFSTFKRGDILRDTLLSVCRQTFTDFEIIVADNDPECSGRQFAESLNDSRIIYHPNGANLGMKASYNKALSLARGEYVVMIADDDPVYPDMLETLINLQREYPGYGMYMGGCDWYCMHAEMARLYKMKVGTNSCISDKHDIGYVQIYSSDEFLFHLYTLNIFKHFLWSTGMVKRDLLLKMGGVPDYGSPFLGDYAYMSISCLEKGCVIINKALGRQTIHLENFGRAQHDQLSVVVNRFPEYLQNKLSYLKDWGSLYKLMIRFTALWVVEHMAFLYEYQVKNNVSEQDSFRKAERDVFSIDFMRSYRIKYYLKKEYRGLHDFIVRIRAHFKKS